MMKKFNRFLFFAIAVFFSSVVHAQTNSVEWAPYVLAQGVSEKQLMIAAERVQVEFVAKQKGVISRQLVKKNNLEFADIIHWQSKADVFAAAEKVNACGVCKEYFRLMDMTAEIHTGSGWSAYEVRKSW